MYPVALAQRLWANRALVSLGLLLAVAWLSLYERVSNYTFVNWDDPIHVYRNPAVMNPEGLSTADRWMPRHLGYPMPLTILSYRLERWLYEMPTPARMRDGRGFHRTSVVLGLLLIICAYLLARELSSRPLAAAAIAALFAAHPILVEPVVWVSGRKDLLAALFSAFAILCWQRHLDSGGRVATLGCFGAAIAALLSKPVAVFLVAWLPYTLWCRRASLRAAGVAAWLALLGLALGVALASFSWNRATGGVQAGGELLATLRRALWALGFHARLIVWPVDLRAKYIVSPSGLSVYDVIGVVLIVLFGALLLRGRRYPRLASCAAIVVLSYLPASSLIPLRRYIADAYLLLPWFGLCMMLANAIGRQHGGGQAAEPRAGLLAGRLVPALFLLLAIVLGVLSHRQIPSWRNSAHLWARVERFHPENAKVCRMHGHAYNEQRQLAKAIGVYERCIKRFGPDGFANNLAISYYLHKDMKNAARWFRWIRKNQPDDRRAAKYLARIRRGVGPPRD